MDNLLKKYHLEEAQKRIMQLSEYSFKTGLAEDDNDQNNNNNPFMDNNQNNQDMSPGMGPNNGQPMDQGMGGPQGPDMNGPQGPGMNDDMGGPQGPDMNGGMGGPQGPDMNDDMGGPQGPDMNGPQDMGQDPTADMPPTDDSLPQDDGIDNMGEGPEAMPDEEMGDEEVDDEDVIDVDDLTQSQEATEYKIDGVNDKISALLQVTTKFVDALKDNEKQIQDLKHEIERRNPTPEERMNIRSQSSYPYGETPRDYWDRKREENPNYNIIYDNDVSPKDEDKEFEIRREDLENLDKRSLADSLEFPKELRDYLDF